jgi:hypothetical protein
VRNAERGQLLLLAYPAVELAYGDLSDSSLLESLAAGSDIVLHCANIEDVGPTQALARGLQRRNRPGSAFWICTSGTDNLTWETIVHKTYGQSQERIYDDLEGISGVLALPEHAPHRDVEAAQQAAASDQIKLAIVCAPCIYGSGRGYGNRRSIQLPGLARYTIEKGRAFRVGAGQNYWPNVHIHDLSDIFLRLITQALAGGGSATWGVEGYYFAENGEHAWGEIAYIVAQEAQAQGFTASAELVSWSAEEADREIEYGSLFYGTDSRCRSLRARRVLGWVPRMHTIEQEIPVTVTAEGRDMMAK